MAIGEEISCGANEIQTTTPHSSRITFWRDLWAKDFNSTLQAAITRI